MEQPPAPDRRPRRERQLCRKLRFWRRFAMTSGLIAALLSGGAATHAVSHKPASAEPPISVVHEEDGLYLVNRQTGDARFLHRDEHGLHVDPPIEEYVPHRDSRPAAGDTIRGTRAPDTPVVVTDAG